MGASAREILAVWERGLRQPLGERALTLLALAGAAPETPERLPAGRRDALLLRIRRQLAGDRIDGLAACAACGERMDLTLSVAELLGGETPVARDPVALALDGYHVEARLPTAADLAALDGRAGVEEGTAQLLQCCVLAAEHDGEPIANEEIPLHVRRALDEAFERADPGGHTLLGADCPACGTANRFLFDIPSLLWRELAQQAHATMLDVADLARAYSWDESAVLALSPARRRFYLEAAHE